MFVSMISVVVILLIISGIIASSAYETKGAVEQANALKLTGEISQLVKGANLYKMTAKGYSGLSVEELNKLEIAPFIKQTEDASGFAYADGSAVASGTWYIESKVNPHIGYVVVPIDDDSYKVRVISQKDSIKAGQKYAVEKAIVSNFKDPNNDNIDNDNNNDGVDDMTDGAIDITFN